MPTDSQDDAYVNLAFRQLLEAYSELNSNVVDELHEEPSALEYMRHVTQNRPFVVRQGARSWNPVRKWDAEYLVDMLGDSGVNVAMTPFGCAFIVSNSDPARNADSVLEKDDGSLSFVKPYEEVRPFAKVIRDIQNQEISQEKSGLVQYAQTQNDNLRGEYAILFESDVPREIPFARIALQKEPDAVNFWLGNSRSVTALHKDNYENIYVQVRGQKHFVLLPPVATPGVNEQRLSGETYAPSKDCVVDEGTGSSESMTLIPIPDGGGEEAKIPVATWDPDLPDKRTTGCSDLLQPMRVTLDEGDMLYLPAMWYHKVSQSCGKEGFCCAVNYWYDMEFGGSFWATNGFIRNVSELVSDSKRQDH